MARYARIVDDVVVEIVELVGELTPADAYHPDIAAAFLPVPEEVEVRWRLEGGALAPPEQPEVDLLAYAADLRWKRETGGIVVGGVPVATDDRSKMMIVGARVAAAADPDWATIWHGADGKTYPVDAAAMIAISNSVQAHVNASFSTFAEVKAAIEAGEITSTAEIDDAFS